MKKENKLLTMMKQLLDGECNCNDFSYDFPDEMFGIEDNVVSDILNEMPEICSWYNPFKEPNDEYADEMLNDQELKEKVKPIYEKLAKHLNQ